MVFSALGGLGYLMLLVTGMPAVNYVGLFLAASGMYPLSPSSSHGEPTMSVDPSKRVSLLPLLFQSVTPVVVSLPSSTHEPIDLDTTKVTLSVWHTVSWPLSLLSS
jgi:hypothetical protein